MKLNLDYLVECIWEHLDLIRVLTKKPGCAPDFDDAIVLRRGVNVKHVCHAIHRSIPELLRYALVWVRKESSIFSVVSKPLGLVNLPGRSSKELHIMIVESNIYTLSISGNQHKIFTSKSWRYSYNARWRRHSNIQEIKSLINVIHMRFQSL